MANIDPAPSWANIRRLETTDRNMAGPGGILNDPTTSIAARLNLLRDNDTSLGNSVAAVNARQDATDNAIANIQGQVLNAPGTLSDLENGAALDPAAAFPDVPSVENSLGPVDAINESIEALTARSKQLSDWRDSDNLALRGNAGASSIGWLRQPLSDDINSVARWLDAQNVELYEFADLVTSRPSTDPSTWDWTPAFSAFSSLPNDNAVILNLPAHTVRISDTITLSRGVMVRGQGMYRSRIVMTDDTKYAINFVMPSTRLEYFDLRAVTVESKRGLVTRYLEGVDVTNSANPSRSLRVVDCQFIGKYNAVTDPLAGSATVPTLTELEGFGTALRAVMVYGAEVYGCIFQNYGIAIENLGCTLSTFSRNRFVSNARHIHDARVAWYNSAFGMGADNSYHSNDILDGRRFGSVTFANSFGTEFYHNYNESLNRGGANSSPMSFDFQNTSGVAFERNHINVDLAVSLALPFLRFRSSRTAALNSDTTANIIRDNRLTPFSGVNSALIDVTANFNAAYPQVLTYLNNYNWPVLTTANVLTAEPSRAVFAFNNLVTRMGIGGTLSTAEDLWVQDTSSGRWYVKAQASNLIFNLTCANPQLQGQFALVFDVDDIAASGGNGRLSATVTDSDGTVLVSSQVIAGVTQPRKYTVVVTSAVLEARKTLKIDIGSTANIKLQGVRLEPLSTNESFKAFDIPAVAPGAAVQTTLTVPGAALGDRAYAAYSANVGALIQTAVVTSANTLAVSWLNPTAAPIDIASGQLVGGYVKSQKY